MTTLAEIGLSDMRRSGFTNYFDTYARNDAGPTGRQGPNVNGSSSPNNGSSQYIRAGLTQGRYILNAEAWNSSINPDYNEISYLIGSSLQTTEYGRCTWWCQIFCADPYGASHTGAWENNTRVLIFDPEIWIKSKSTGQWTLARSFNTIAGESFSPNFNNYMNQVDLRQEVSSGYWSARPIYSSGEPTGWGYYIFHGYGGGVFSVDKNDIADIISLCKTSLVIHDTFNYDDRDDSRYLFAVGADWYPTTGGLPYYPGIGTSKHKLVTAKWPSWQYHVMHTMTTAQWNAANGYPAIFDTRAENNIPPPDGGSDPTPIPVVKPIAAWQPLLVSGENNWGTQGDDITPYISGGVPPIFRRRRH